jgi:hypothetical protein
MVGRQRGMGSSRRVTKEERTATSPSSSGCADEWRYAYRGPQRSNLLRVDTTARAYPFSDPRRLDAVT